MKLCLVVDDSRVVRAVACGGVQLLGFDTKEAEDAVTALRHCENEMPDLILVDSDLPDMSGVEFLRKLRRNLRGRRPVVIYCTMLNDHERIAQALSAGASQYLLKPFDLETLKATLTKTAVLVESASG